MVQDFLKELEEKKINPFQMTYMDGEYLYIALGYGEQPTGGFSITIHGLYETGDKLCLETVPKPLDVADLFHMIRKYLNEYEQAK